MDIKNMSSDLRMEDFYFSESKVERLKKISDGEYHVELNKNIDETDQHKYSLCLTLTISKEDIHIFLKANANFIFESENYNSQKEQDIINKNGVAIMFPFIRSQVSLLTTQPGMMPIILPPINTAKFK